jgi:hypothetical protein
VIKKITKWAKQLDELGGELLRLIPTLEVILFRLLMLYFTLHHFFNR